MLELVVSMLIIGHRGASGHLPENTLPAFEKAIEMQADGVELDIWPASDGTPMVIHDPTLDRTTPQRGVVAEYAPEALQALGVPTYGEVLALAHGKLIIFTELKGDAGTQVGAMIDAAVREQGWNHAQLPVIGFDHTQLRRLKMQHPDILIGVSFSRRMMEPIPAALHARHMIQAAQEAGAYAINPDFRLVNAALVKQAHEAGLKVNVWTVNTLRDMRRMRALGVDAVMTDYPDRLHGLLHPEP